MLENPASAVFKEPVIRPRLETKVAGDLLVGARVKRQNKKNGVRSVGGSFAVFAGAGPAKHSRMR
jgi:hypothetical protein